MTLFHLISACQLREGKGRRAFGADRRGGDPAEAAAVQLPGQGPAHQERRPARDLVRQGQRIQLHQILQDIR